MRLINQIAFLVSIGCALFGLNPAEAQTLKLRYPLNDATANTYYPSDSSLGGVAANNLVTYNISGTAANKHGVAGSGVGGNTPAMDFTGQPDISAGTTNDGPVAYDTADSHLGFGTVSDWTVTLWFNQDPANAPSAQPILFILGVNGTTATGTANSIGVRMAGGGGGNNANPGVLQVYPGGGEQDFQITSPSGTAFSGWRFVAITYTDATKTLTVYSGTTNTTVAQAVTSPKTLGSSAAIAFGSSGSVFIGNRSNQQRIYSAWYQDFRFYSGSASQATLDQIRQSILQPAITSGGQPQSGSYAPGQTAQLTVVAAGAAPLVYQWQATNSAAGGFTNLTDGGQITGSQSNVLTIANVATANALAYQVIVTNSYGAVTSAPAILSVLSVPIINSQPVSQTALGGSTVSFTVGATGVGTLGYQWQASGGASYTNLVDNGIVSGSGTSTLTLTGVTTNFALSYQVIVTNANGSVTGAPPATLTVLPATCLINGDIGTGATQTGAAVLGAPGDVWNPLSATTATVTNSAGIILTGVGITLNDGGQLYADAGGDAMDGATTPLMEDYAYVRAGYTTTDTVSITGLAPYTNYPFTLVVYAAGDTASQGADLTLTAGAAGGNSASTLTTTAASRQISAGAGVAYQIFTGALTGGTLTFNSTLLSGQSFGGLNGFQLQLNPLVIATQPVSQTNFAGNMATFTVGAVGTGILNYQWQATNAANGGFTNLTDGGQISGSQSNVLTIANLTTNWALAYQVIISNGSVSVTSSPATLTVLTSPVITTQPVSQTSVAGSPVTFNVTALGTPPLDFQWQATNSSAGGFTNIAGASAIDLTLTSVTTNFALAYQVIVTNNYGSVTSAVAALTVLPFVAQPTVPDPGVMGPALVANVTGSYSAPPANLVSSTQTGGAVTGNGDLAIIVGGASSSLDFYVGKSDFWGVERGSIMPVGTLVLSASALSGSSYSLNQNVGPATLTGAFVNGSSALSVTSWVASAENTAVIQLNNTGTSSLSLTSQLLDGLAGSAGNPATYGSTNNSTWLYVSPDTVYLELGNHLHMSSSAPFTGKIADLRFFNQVLPGSTLATIDSPSAPVPLLQWQTTNMGAATLVGSGASLNNSDPFGGSVVLTGNSGSELAVGDLPLPERQFTVSAWINLSATGENGCLVAAQVPYVQLYGSGLYPFPRGLSLNLVNGALSATLNESGYYVGSLPDYFNPDAVNKFTTTAGNSLPANQWIEAAVTYDGNVMTIYTNGVQVGVTTSFPTGFNGLMGWNKMAIHLGDTNVIYNGCAPQGILMQSVLGATATTNGQGALTFTVPAGGQATIVLAGVTDRNNPNYFAAAQQQSEQATTASLTNLFQAHNLWWSNFWTKSYVQIPDQTIQNAWYAGLYLLACGSSSNCPPLGQIGNFITTPTPGYQGDYTLDYNFECPPLAGLACNHLDMVQSYDQMLLDQKSRGEAIAQNFYGMTNALNFYVHLVPAPGWSDDIYALEGIKWNALYTAVVCAQRWKYTMDTNYAARIYPYLKEVVNFWNNNLVLQNGYYQDLNDASFENVNGDNNPTMPASFLRLVYPVVVQMSQALNVDAASRVQWINVLANLNPLPIVPASSISSLASLGLPYDAPGVNVLRQTTSGTAFGTPHVTTYQNQQITSSGTAETSAQAVVPGWNIGLESDPGTFLAASNTVWLMGAWFDFNANCFAYAGAASVNFPANTILTNLHNFLTDYSLPNFMIDVSIGSEHGEWAEQAVTVPMTLPAMFLQSYQTNVHLFPDWPTNQSAAFGNLNACGGFLVSGAITLGSANYVQVQSTAGQLLKMANPWPGATVQCVSSLTGISTLSGSVLNYQTQVGEVLTLTSTTVTNLPAPTNLTASLNGGAASLTWNAVPGAGGYNMKRSTSFNGPYLNITSSLTGTNYNDTSLTGHTTYYYAVTALAPGFESTNSAVVTVAPPVIANWSFENPVVTDGNFTTTLPGWNTSGNAGAFAIINPGTANWPSASPAGLDGANAGQIFMTAAGQSGIFYQDTGIKYVAGVTYQLTAAIGLETNQTFDTNSALVFYNSALTAIASNVITPANLIAGAFTNVSLRYTATGSEGGNGDVVVGFYAPPAAVGSSYFDFDNVCLTMMVPVSTNASLTSLVVSPALSFTPSFIGNTFSYGATVAYGSTPTVTVADANGNATNQLIYNGVTNVLASGVASAALTLNPNPALTNVIQVQVTAQDGVTKQTYTVNVTQLPNQATPPGLTNSVSNGTLNLSWGLDRLGYRLLMQTNNLNLGVSSNPNDWATVPGSMMTNTLAIPIVTTNLNEFYRLVYP